MGSYVVLGAGPIGRESALLLAGEGHAVTLASRSAGALKLDGVRTVSADATNASELARISKGADVIVMAAMAEYHRWAAEFFPILDGAVQAAEAVDARLVLVGNVYGYGENAANPLGPDAPLDPTTKKGAIRTAMWQRALRSPAPVIEIRAADYLGAGAVTYFSLLVLPQLLKGEPVGFLGSFDEVHAWSYTKDVARTVVAAAAYEGQWNRAFMAPVQHATVRDLIGKVAEMRGIGVPPLKILSSGDLAAASANELVEMTYQWDRPLLVDDRETRELLGISATSLDLALQDTLAAS